MVVVNIFGRKQWLVQSIKLAVKTIKKKNSKKLLAVEGIANH